MTLRQKIGKYLILFVGAFAVGGSLTQLYILSHKAAGIVASALLLCSVGVFLMQEPRGRRPI